MKLLRIIEKEYDLPEGSLEKYNPQDKNTLEMMQGVRVASFFMRVYEDRTFKSIADQFNYRDHVSIIIHIRVIEGMLFIDKFNNHLTDIKRVVYGK